MKFHLQASSSLVVAALGPDWIRVGITEYRDNLILSPEAVVPNWAPGGFAALTAQNFADLLQFTPEIVLLGTGAGQRFPHPTLLRPLAEAHVGVEAMDTRAACRTYNILVAEGRRVVAALLLR